MITQLYRIATVFSRVAQEEDAQLAKLCKEGIFFMPELAYSYACGKAILSETDAIFGNTKVTWFREYDLFREYGLENGGPSDLVFVVPDEKKIVVEVKMIDTLTNYLSDIVKLNKLSPQKHVRIFCALIDLLSDPRYDARLDLENAAKKRHAISLEPLIKPFPRFPTMQPGKKGRVIFCEVQVWLVGKPEDIPGGTT
jgi:hypothetical protein